VRSTAHHCIPLRIPLRLQFLGAVGLVAIAAHGFWAVYVHSGLFKKLGADYALYHAQALTLRTLGPGSMYAPEALHATLQTLLRESNPQAVAGYSSVPYPPLFSWLLTPLTFLNLSQAFVLWTLLNVIAAVYLGLRCASLVRGISRLLVVLLVMAAYPVTLTLFLGQIQVWLACVVAEAYVALRTSRDLAAGLWLGLLIIKPQYLMLLVPLALWKRRWQLIYGIAISAAAIWIGSAVAVGLESLRAYPQAFSVMLGFHSDWPQAMINWRGLLLNVRPETGERSGFAVTLLLGLATSVPALMVWRSGWHADRADFPAKLTLLFIATLLTIHQSHGYGAAVLTVLIMAAWVTPYASPLLRSIILIGAFFPTLILTTNFPVSFVDIRLFARIRPATVVTAVSLVASYLILLRALFKSAASTSDLPL